MEAASSVGEGLEGDLSSNPAHNDRPFARLLARIQQKFQAVMVAIERPRNEAADRDASWTSRLWSRTLSWLAERVAEQRLLWHLRRHDLATLYYPSDMAEADADGAVRASLKRDYDRHRIWLGVDGLLLIASAVLALVPGPNLIAYYFAFRVVGHYLCMRGARQGLEVVRWTFKPSDALADLRGAVTLQPPQRERHVLDVASRLHLQHLATFFERIVPRSA
jgi:Mitochondrial K+-H+ exchange-related